LARQTGGQIESVNDDEIRAGIKLLAETTGVFTETAGGVTVGVLTKLAEAGKIGSDERVVVYITGEGLKTLDAARESFRMHEIEPTLDAFEAEFQGVGASA
jgi:threonine synthase